MTSLFVTEKPASPLASESPTSSDMPSSRLALTKPTTDAPSSTPALEDHFPTPADASDTIEKVSAATIIESTHPTMPASESDSDLMDKLSVEIDRPMALNTSMNRAETELTGTTSDKGVMQQTIVNSETRNTSVVIVEGGERARLETNVINGSQKLESEILISVATEDLHHDAEAPTIVPEAGRPEEEEDRHKPIGEMQGSDMRERGAIAVDGDDNCSMDDGESAVELQRNGVTENIVSQSVPSHMRSAFKTPNTQHPSAFEKRPHWPTTSPRGPRSYLSSAVHHLPDELQRTKDQLIKVRSELDEERKANAEIRNEVEAEKQTSMVAAMGDMLSQLLQKQADALAAKARAQDKERDLQYREQMITQIETYLASGQKHLKWELEQQGIRTMSSVDEANLRREIELRMKHQLSDIEGKISIQVERLRHQEAAQKIREQQYKALARDALEKEIREEVASDMRAKAPDTTCTRASNDCGLAEDRKLEGDKCSEDELKLTFLRGYAACHHTLTILQNVRNSKMAPESPEASFLFDCTHPENPHNIGLDIGRMEGLPTKGKAAAGGAISQNSAEEFASKVSAVRARGRTLFNEAAPHSCQPVASSERARPVQQAAPTQTREAQQAQQALQKHPSNSCASSRSTFAGELRGSSSAVICNGMFASSLNPQTTSKAPRAIMESRMGQGVYAGRRTVRYEEDHEDDTPAPNLIDFY